MDEDQKPTMTEQELWEWLLYDEGIPVTRRGGQARSATP